MTFFVFVRKCGKNLAEISKFLLKAIGINNLFTQICTKCDRIYSVINLMGELSLNFVDFLSKVRKNKIIEPMLAMSRRVFMLNP